MKKSTVNVRELTGRLSCCLRLVKAGLIVEITERGNPLGRIVRGVASFETRIDAARRPGLLSWNGQKLKPHAPVVKVCTKKTLAEIVVKNRR
jgi:antitoxin (DNA-binding transcriptional repressor) of toxin-antitoxin stability system